MYAHALSLVQNWSEIVTDTNDTMFYIPDRQLQKMVGEKLRYLSRLCQARIINILDQASQEKRKKLMQILQDNKPMSAIQREKKCKEKSDLIRNNNYRETIPFNDRQNQRIIIK